MNATGFCRLDEWTSAAIMGAINATATCRLDEWTSATIMGAINATATCPVCPPVEWTPADIMGAINMGISFLSLLFVGHSWYRHRHFHSECMGAVCCDFDSVVDAKTPRGHESPRTPPTGAKVPSIVITPPPP